MLCDFEGLDLNLVTEVTTFSDSIKDVYTCKSCHQQTKKWKLLFWSQFHSRKIIKRIKLWESMRILGKSRSDNKFGSALCKHFLNANFRFIDHLIDVWWGHICFRKIFIYKKVLFSKKKKNVLSFRRKKIIH